MTIDRTALCRTVAVINSKGGVGKTSLVANLAALLASNGYTVLAVDLDPQGNLGVDLGYLGLGLSDAGASLATAAQLGIAPEIINGVRPGLDVIAGGEMLHDLAAALQARTRRTGDGSPASTLASSIASAAGKYDVALLDCPPGSDVLQDGALLAARHVVIPTKTDAASRAGLRDIAQRFSRARVQNAGLALLGVVLFGVTSRAHRVERRARDEISRDLGEAPGLIFSSTIRHVEAAASDARSRGQVAHELSRDVDALPPWYERIRDRTKPSEALASSARQLAEDYQCLTVEILDRIADAERPRDSTDDPHELVRDGMRNEVGIR